MEESTPYYLASILMALFVLTTTVYGTFTSVDARTDAQVKITQYLYDVATVYETISFNPNPTIIIYKNPDFQTAEYGHEPVYRNYKIISIRKCPKTKESMTNEGVGYLNYIEWNAYYQDDYGMIKSTSYNSIANNQNYDDLALASQDKCLEIIPAVDLNTKCAENPDTICEGGVVLSNRQAGTEEKPLESLIKQIITVKSGAENEKTGLIKLEPKYKFEAEGTEICLQKRMVQNNKPQGCYGDGTDYLTYKDYYYDGNDSYFCWTKDGEPGCITGDEECETTNTKCNIARNWGKTLFQDAIITRKTEEYIACCGIDEDLTEQCYSLIRLNEKCGCDEVNNEIVCNPPRLTPGIVQAITGTPTGSVPEEYLPIPDVQRCENFSQKITMLTTENLEDMGFEKTISTQTEDYWYMNEACYDLQNLGGEYEIIINGYGSPDSADGVISRPNPRNVQNTDLVTGEEILVPASTNTNAIYIIRREGGVIRVMISHSPDYYYLDTKHYTACGEIICEGTTPACADKLCNPRDEYYGAYVNTRTPCKSMSEVEQGEIMVSLGVLKETEEGCNYREGNVCTLCDCTQYCETGIPTTCGEVCACA